MQGLHKETPSDTNLKQYSDKLQKQDGQTAKKQNEAFQKGLGSSHPERVSGSHLSDHQTLKYPEISGQGDANCGFKPFWKASSVNFA